MTVKASAYVGGLLGILLAAGASAGADLNAPSAHNPCFDRPGLWPEDVKKTAYYRQKWEPTRLLVWARADQQRAQKDALLDPKNWLEYPPSPGGYDETSGKPATNPPDENTDVLFPDSDRPYQVGGDVPLRVRHITVGENAGIWMNGRLEVSGNQWVRKGAGTVVFHTRVVRGKTAAFARNDRSDPKGGGLPAIYGNNLGVSKPKGGSASVEFIGNWCVGDELHVDSGTMILGPGSRFVAGDRGLHTVHPEGTLVLMSGSALRTMANKGFQHDLAVGGALLAGTPERPLTRDCVLGLSFKVHGEVDALPRGMSTPNDSGLVINPGGRLAVHSADPAKARLVFRWHGQKGLNIGPAKPEDIKDVPHRIAIVLRGEVEFNGVEFNDMRRGGIVLADPSVRSRWKNVFYGGNNGAGAEELYRAYDGPPKPVELRGN